MIVVRARQRGIALLQVLLISAILSVLALYFTLTARQQLHVAQLADDRTEALLAVKSAESRLLFDMLVSGPANLSGEHYPNANMSGSPVLLRDGVELKLQDSSGLLNLWATGYDRLTRVFEGLGVEPTRAAQLADGILDWQDTDDYPRINGGESQDHEQGPRNRNIHLMGELMLINGMDQALFDQFAPLVTLQQVPYFNPKQAPGPLLTAVSDGDVQQVLDLRKQGNLSNREFSDLTGIFEREGQVFASGDTFAISLMSKKGHAVVEKQMQLKLDPYAEPGYTVVDYLEVTW